MSDRADDAALLEAWCAGDEDSGDRLLRRSFPTLYRFLWNKIGEDTGDLVQQTMLAALEHRDKLAECINFEAYLVRIARNKLYDLLRKRARTPEAQPGTLPSVMELRTSASSLVGRKERDRRVLEMLRTLPVDLQTVLELHYWNELSTAEIADALEIPAGTVKSRLRRARAEFEAGLADEPLSADIIADLRP